MTGAISPMGGGEEAASSAASPSELRASHEDRDRTVEMLRVAAGDGRLTAEELDQRLEAALTARTYGELAGLTRDLPAAPGLSPAAGRKDLVRIECASGSARRDGRWVVPQRMAVRVTSGSVKLDFTQAAITQPSLLIDAEVRSGTLTLITRPGIEVDADDVSVRSGGVRVRRPAGYDGPHLLSIRVSGKVGSGSIKARPPRRTLWQWLTRQPVRYPALP